MIDRRHHWLLLGTGLLTLGLSGCASNGSKSLSAWRPGNGAWSITRPGINGGRTWNGPLVQPGTGLQPTPAMPSPPAIVPGPGPALPDASGNRYRLFPGATGIRYPYPQRQQQQRQRQIPAPRYRLQPRVVPQQGAPIARQQSPSNERPAELSGQIEIIPGPTLRAQRARMELLPPPPEGNAASNAHTTSQLRDEATSTPPLPEDD